MKNTNYTKYLKKFTINFGPQHPVAQRVLRLMSYIKKKIQNFSFKSRLFGLELIAFISEAVKQDNTSLTELDVLVLLKKAKPEGFITESEACIDIIAIQQEKFVCFKIPMQVGEIKTIFNDQAALSQSQYGDMIITCHTHVNETVGKLAELHTYIPVLGVDPLASTHLSDTYQLLGFLSHHPTLAAVVLVSSSGVISYLKDEELVRYPRQCFDDFIIKSQSQIIRSMPLFDRIVLIKSCTDLLQGTPYPVFSKNNPILSFREIFKKICFPILPNSIQAVNASTNSVEVSGSIEVSGMKTEITGAKGDINGIKGPVVGRDLMPSTTNVSPNILPSAQNTINGDGGTINANVSINIYSVFGANWDGNSKLAIAGGALAGAGLLPLISKPIRSVTLQEFAKVRHIAETAFKHLFKK